MGSTSQYDKFKSKLFAELNQSTIQDISELRRLANRLILVARNEKSPQIITFLESLIHKAKMLNDLQTEMRLLFEKLNQIWAFKEYQEETYAILDRLLTTLDHNSVFFHVVVMEKHIIDRFYGNIDRDQLRTELIKIYRNLENVCKTCKNATDNYYYLFGKLMFALNYYHTFDPATNEDALQMLLETFDCFIQDPFAIRNALGAFMKIVYYYRNNNDYAAFQSFVEKVKKAKLIDNAPDKYKAIILYGFGSVELLFGYVEKAEQYLTEAYKASPPPPHYDQLDISIYCNLLYDYSRVLILQAKLSEAYALLLKLKAYIEEYLDPETAQYFSEQKKIQESFAALFFFILQELNVNIIQIPDKELNNIIDDFLNFVSKEVSTITNDRTASHNNQELEMTYSMSLILLTNLLRGIEKQVKLKNRTEMLESINKIRAYLRDLPWAKELFENELLLTDVYHAKVLLLHGKEEELRMHLEQNILSKERSNIPTLEIWQEALLYVYNYFLHKDIQKFSEKMNLLLEKCTNMGYKQTHDEVKIITQYLVTKHIQKDQKEAIRQQAMKEAYLRLSEKMGRELVETLRRKQ